jgi:diguanylate cyclase (GGDEF)-like protein
MSMGDIELPTTGNVTGLTSFETPDLAFIEGRRFQLWVLALALLFSTVALLGLVLFWEKVSFPVWLPVGLIYIALVGLVLLFSAYAIEKELELRALTAALLEEQVLTAGLTNSLREAQVLLEAGKAVTLRLDLDQVLETILRCSMELLDAQGGSVMMLHSEEELRTVYSAGKTNARGRRVHLHDGIAGRVAATREPVLVRGTFDWMHYESNPGSPRPTSAISVPLINDDQLIGVLNLNAKPRREYTRHDLRALSLFGGQAASAIANAQAFETQRVIAYQSSYQAMHDPLTGLPNRVLLMDRIGNALARRRPPEQEVVLLFVDLDDFKRVNDSLGQRAGDQVLISLAERLRTSVRAGDSVAHFGGDEFAVLLEASSSVEAIAAAERILGDLTLPFAIEGREVRFSASIGIALQRPRDATAELIMRNAFTALHAAKDRGKGQVAVFEQSMHSTALDRLDLEQDLRNAIDQDQLDVFFQPVLDLADLSIHAVEALVRWHHPDRGLTPAHSFVSVAEEAGFQPLIDRMVLRRACAAVCELNAGILSRKPVSAHVNLSPLTLQDPDFVTNLAWDIEESGIDPEQLVLEITESVILRDVEQVASRLRAVKSIGARLALDDFGTGYSSLSYLRSFPVDVVKIDRMFVDGLAKDAGAAALVQAIVRLGLGLAFEVVAEGIENQDQLEKLLDLGCRYGQGFYLANPLSTQELVTFLERPEIAS